LLLLGRCFSSVQHIPLDTDDEDQLGLSGDESRVVDLGGTTKADLLTLSAAVLLNVLLSTLEDNATLLLVGLFQSC
jgi:hypothetical protein